MNSSDRFKPVLKIAASREQTAAKDFGKSQKIRQEEEQKLEGLKAYHREYRERLHVSASKGINAIQLQEYHVFLSNLEKAISEQEERVAATQQDCLQHKDIWRQKHMKTQVIDNAMLRMKKVEQKQQDRREQKAADEHSQRIFHSR